MHFTSCPELLSERLLLRQVDGSDIEAIFFLRSDSEVNRYIIRPRTLSTRDAEAFLERIHKGIAAGQNLYWAITLRSEPAMIGGICLWNFSADRKRAELGYELHPGFHGQGIMTEAIGLVKEYGFTLGFETFEAFTHCDNEASVRLLQRNGFVHLPHRHDPDNEFNTVFSARLP